VINLFLFRVSDARWRICQFGPGWFITSSTAFTNGVRRTLHSYYWRNSSS